MAPQISTCGKNVILVLWKFLELINQGLDDQQQMHLLLYPHLRRELINSLPQIVIIVL